MKNNKKNINFTDCKSLEAFLLNYMKKNSEYELYVYLRYGYTAEEMKKSNFRIEICGLYNFNDVLWWNDWNEGESFIEVQSIVTSKEVENLAKEKVLE